MKNELIIVLVNKQLTDQQRSRELKEFAECIRLEVLEN